VPDALATPPLPDWIRDARVDGYTTAHRLCPQETRLYGTESMYGDWNGRMLLLAKDFAPSRVLHERIKEGCQRPYHHDPKLRTNVRLMHFVAPFENLGLVYGSALANLLRDDGEFSGALPNRKGAMEHGIRVARFVIEHMPALRWIVCLGREGWDCACGAQGVQGDWRVHRDSGEPLERLVAAYHPSARVSREQMTRSWEAFKRAAEREPDSNAAAVSDRTTAESG
jgi:hypothetical protein